MDVDVSPLDELEKSSNDISEFGFIGQKVVTETVDGKRRVRH